MLPKLLEAPMRMYLMMLEKTLRPSITPSSSTSSDFSSRIMSADSLAMSTAVSTLIPTSAAWSAGASLIPSPMKPTVCLRDLERLDDPLLVRGGDPGEQRGRLGGLSELRFASSSRRRRPAGRRPVSPTSLQTLRATISLSPVMTLTATP